MKKMLATVLSAVVLLTAVPLSMTSCSQSSRLMRMKEEERAEVFYELILGNAEQAYSSSMEQTTSMSMEINGQAYEQTTEGTITFIGEEDDFTLLEQFKTTVHANQIDTVIYEDSGYADGMMFLYNREEGKESKLKSPISAMDYDAFRAQLKQDDEKIMVGPDYTETVTCVRNDDKTWTATYEGFTEEGMKPFIQMIAGIEYAVTDEYDLSDVRMTCRADEDLYPTEILIEYVFEENPEAKSDMPELSVRTQYKGWNNTVLSEPYDISDFTEVEDLRTVEQFLKSLQERESAKSGSFRVSTSVYSQYGNQPTQNDVFSQSVSFRGGEEGMEFTLNYTQFGYKVTSVYKNGIMTTTVCDEATGAELQKNSVSTSPFEVQATIQQLMNSESISGTDIVDAKVTDAEKGTYHFTLGDAVKSKLDEEYMGSYGVVAKEFSGHIDATIEEGKLKKYTYYVKSVLDLPDMPLEIEVYMTVYFSDPVQGGSSL